MLRPSPSPVTMKTVRSGLATFTPVATAGAQGALWLFRAADGEPVTNPLAPIPPPKTLPPWNFDRVPVERVFIAPRSRPRYEVLRGLGASVVDGWVHVDEAVQTNVPGLYAVGNVVDVYANVAMSIGAGSATGGAVNADLTMEDTRLAVAST